MNNKREIRGFTLVEMIIVIVITGIIGGIVAVFLRLPVQGYVDGARRAEMTDIADTALRRIQRDLRLALPNSVRVRNAAGTACGAGDTCYLEFIPTSGGGRYRDAADNLGGGNVLNFGASVTTFDVLGAPPAAPNPGTDFIVLNNTTSDPADLISNAYAGGNRSAYTGRAGSTITIAAKTFPVSLNSCVSEDGFVVGGCRFQVVHYPVTYVCTPVAGGAGGTLTRWAEGAFAAVQPIGVPPAVPVLANNVSACNFAYASGISQRTGLVTMHLTITEQGESVNLYAATHVSNVP